MEKKRRENVNRKLYVNTKTPDKASTIFFGNSDDKLDAPPQKCEMRLQKSFPSFYYHTRELWGDRLS
jgi:hypothetical protein